MQVDFGRSLANDREISELIGLRFGNTLFLAAIAAVISVPLAVSLGVLAALYRNSFFDRAINVITLSSISFPESVFTLAESAVTIPESPRRTLEFF